VLLPRRAQLRTVVNCVDLFSVVPQDVFLFGGHGGVQRGPMSDDVPDLEKGSSRR